MVTAQVERPVRAFQRPVTTRDGPCSLKTVQVWARRNSQPPRLTNQQLRRPIGRSRLAQNEDSVGSNPSGATNFRVLFPSAACNPAAMIEGWTACGSIPPALTEGRAQWWATGPENRAVARRGFDSSAFRHYPRSTARQTSGLSVMIPATPQLARRLMSAGSFTV
jgi:hypothetical protein